MPQRKYRLVRGTATYRGKELKVGDIITSGANMLLIGKNKYELVEEAPVQEPVKTLETPEPVAPESHAGTSADTQPETPETPDPDAPVSAEEILVPIFEKSSPKIGSAVLAMLGNLKEAGIESGEEFAAFLEASEDPVADLSDFDGISKATAKKIVAEVEKGIA